MITIDVLRRAGAEVTVASVEPSLEVTCSRQVKLVADALIDDCMSQKWDVIALPGGMPGAERLRDSEHVAKLIAEQRKANKLLAAICATPAVALEPQGLLKGVKATCHPGFSNKLSDQSEVDRRVVVDGSVITSRGPGTAFEFALELVKQLYGDEVMKKVAGPMVMMNGWDDSINNAKVN